MNELEIRKRAVDITSKLNEKYPGIIHEDIVNLFLTDLYDSDLSDAEIEKKIAEGINRVVSRYVGRNRRRNKSLESHYDLNEMFDCRITNNTLHIHVVPKSVKEYIARVGLKKFIGISDERLFDAFCKISDIIQLEENLHIENVFAVSPLLKVSAVQALFRNYGFEVGMTKNIEFIEMFGTKKVGEAIIKRDKFMTMVSERKLAKMMENEVVNDELELEKMLNETEEAKEEKKQVVEEKSDNKVLVKKRESSNEGGYGTVFGVVLVIISITFILSGLFIRMLS